MASGTNRWLLVGIAVGVAAATALLLWGGMDSLGAPVGPAEPRARPPGQASTLRDQGRRATLAEPEPPAGAVVPPAPVVAAPAPRVLQLEVVDAAGDPAAGVPLALLDDPPGRPARWRGRTAASGAVSVDLSSLAPGGALVATLALPLADAPRMRIDRAAPAPVRFVLPELGSVRATVAGVGAAWAEEVEVVLRLAEPPSAWAPDGADQRGVVHDAALFSYVGLGLPLAVEARAPWLRKHSQARFWGPRAPGEQVSVVLDLGEGAVTELTGTLFGPRGAPLRAAEFIWQVVAADRLPDRRTSRTDADGRFRFCFATPAVPVTFTARVRLVERDLAAAWALPEPVPPGSVDAGVVTLQPPPRAAAGRVVDARGAGIAGAQVAAVPRRGDEDGYTVHRRAAQVAAKTDAVRTGDDGVFDLAAGGDSPRVGLYVHADGFAPRQNVQVARGSTGVRLELQATGALAGSVRLPPGLDPALLELRARGTTPRSRSFALGRPDADGAFVLAGLLTEPTRVEIELLGVAEPLLQIDDLQPPPGETLRDPRLQDVDLTGLTVFPVSVTDREGHPLSEAVVAVEGLDEGTLRAYVLPYGEATLALRAPPAALLAWARGYRAARVPSPAPGAAVALLPALQVELAVHDPEWPAGADWQLKLEPTVPPERRPYVLARHGGGAAAGTGEMPWQRVVAAPLDRDGTARLSVPRPGDYRVVWSLVRRFAGGESHGPPIPAQTVTVVESAAAQRFAVSLPSGTAAGR